MEETVGNNVEVETVTSDAEETSFCVTLTDDVEDGSGMFVISDEQSIHPQEYYADDPNIQQMPVVVYENAEDPLLTDYAEVAVDPVISAGEYHSTSLVTTASAGELYAAGEFMVASGHEYQQTSEPTPVSADEYLIATGMVSTTAETEPSYIYPVSLQPAAANPPWTSEPFPVQKSLIKKFECAHCGRQYSTYKSLKTHHAKYKNCQPVDRRKIMLENNNALGVEPESDGVKGLKPFKCYQCGKAYSALRNLNYHQQTSKTCGVWASDFRPFSCDICGKKFKLNKYLQQHKAKVKCIPNSNPTSGTPAQIYKPFFCKLCKKRFSTQQGWNYHRKFARTCQSKLGTADRTSPEKEIVFEDVAESENPFECGQCGQKFASSDSLRSHQTLEGECIVDADHIAPSQTEKVIPTKQTAAGGYKCESCSKTYTSYKYFQMHLKVHQRGSSFRCEHCNQCYSSNEHLRRHVNSAHLGVRYKCSLCDKRFTTYYWLKQHFKIHSRELPFKCMYCTQRFSNRESRRLHEVAHIGEKPFKCLYCTSRFRNRPAVLAHMRHSHGVRHTKQDLPLPQNLYDGDNSATDDVSSDQLGQPAVRKYIAGNRLKPYQTNPHVHRENRQVIGNPSRVRDKRATLNDKLTEYDEDGDALVGDVLFDSAEDDQGMNRQRKSTAGILGSSRRTSTRTIRAPKKYEEDYVFEFDERAVKEEPLDEQIPMSQASQGTVAASLPKNKRKRMLNEVHDSHDGGNEEFEAAGAKEGKKLPKFELTMKMLDNMEADADEPVVIEVDYVITAPRKKKKKRVKIAASDAMPTGDAVPSSDVSPMMPLSQELPFALPSLQTGSVGSTPVASVSAQPVVASDASASEAITSESLIAMLPMLTSTIAQQESVAPPAPQGIADAGTAAVATSAEEAAKSETATSESSSQEGNPYLDLQCEYALDTGSVDCQVQEVTAASMAPASEALPHLKEEEETELPFSDVDVAEDPDYTPGDEIDKHIKSDPLLLEASASKHFNEHVCNKCGKGFSSRFTLGEHQQVSRTCGHSPHVKPFSCETCGRGFALKKYLSQHKAKTNCALWANIDVGDAQLSGPPFVCQNCGNKFKKLQFLKFHIMKAKCSSVKPPDLQRRDIVVLSELEQRTLKCDDCGRQLMSFSSLRKHKRAFKANSEKSDHVEAHCSLPQKKQKSSCAQESLLGMHKNSGWKFVSVVRPTVMETTSAVKAISIQPEVENRISEPQTGQNDEEFVKLGGTKEGLPLNAAVSSLVIDEKAYTGIHDDHDYGRTYCQSEDKGPQVEQLDEMVTSVTPVVDISSGLQNQPDFVSPEGDVIEPLTGDVDAPSSGAPTALPSTVSAEEQLYRVEIVDGVLTLIAMDNDDDHQVQAGKTGSSSPVEEYELELTENGMVVGASTTGDVFLDEKEVLELVQGAQVTPGVSSDQKQ